MFAKIWVKTDRSSISRGNHGARVKCGPADRPTGKLRTTKMRTLRNRTPNERCAVMCISLL